MAPGMKKFMMSVTDDVYEALLDSKKKRGLNSTQEVVRQIVGEWYAEYTLTNPPGEIRKRITKR